MSDSTVSRWVLVTWLNRFVLFLVSRASGPSSGCSTVCVFSLGGGVEWFFPVQFEAGLSTRGFSPNVSSGGWFLEASILGAGTASPFVFFVVR